MQTTPESENASQEPWTRSKTQRDLCRIKVSPQAVSKWERGENGPDIALLGALARLLGVSTDWLLGADGEGRDVFEATVFTSGVDGAYEKSLQMAARDFASWANGFFSPLTESVLRYNGVPVKYRGDKFLCFFSGTDHRLRAVQAALLATRLVSERLAVGLSSGDIYLGAMGYTDYARPDIMGEVVNLAFLILDWAETDASTGIGAAASVAASLDHSAAEIGRSVDVSFRGIDTPVTVYELGHC
ncbi:MAG: helix-turn-helix domain-containing protein [Candidatus Latescibacteria bacterium]|nr:helix-turn-helix domain-containing protein [Candidatus Latescibacterota bacterium]